MWQLEIENDQQYNQYLTAKVVIEDELFLNSLTDRLKVYPSYVGMNKNWWAIMKPCKPYITPFPEQGNVLIRINTTIRIPIPLLPFTIQKEKLTDALKTELLKWLNEEHLKFQVDWNYDLIQTAMN